ncbi:DUF4190 domain-containing protein [Cryobacterium zhongshanensis]|uniref:DUF4190 domain-containing protein n=1 Tax=Cryobacterium zhongshanensis TaxID=2928153 RepID=A0AA41R2H6_9MICO|nr:DUF4190 domain-containing protein [Cryobacterium zhongshanensis]MCI4659671.1 DUF4190 domain-containing protein [Cryobacterium zhongshanensis]
MGLFLNEIATTKRPPVSALAVASLIVAATGFLNVVGFIVGPVLAHIALIRLRKTHERGRRLAIATLWVSYGSLIAAGVSLLVILIAAYAALPQPNIPTPHIF